MIKELCNRYLFFRGVVGGTTTEEQGHIKTINEQSFFSFLFALLFSLACYLVGGAEILATFVFAVSFGYLISIYLNHKQYYVGAIFLLNSWTHIVVLVGSTVLGFSSNAHFVIILAAMTIKMDYQHRKTPLIRWNYVLSYAIILFVILNDLFEFILPLNPIASEKYVQYIIFLIVLIVAQKTLGIYHVNNEKVSEFRTEKQAAAERSNEQKSNYLASVSHEIRTPLHALMGFSQLLKDTKSIDKKEHYQSIMQKKSEELLSLVNGIMDTAKIEAHEIELNEEKLSLKAFFDELLEEYTLMNPKDASVSIDCQLEKDVQLMADSLRLKQVFRNLLNNALKYTYEGSVSFGLEKTEGGLCYFFVRDTGVGIPKEKINTIFELYQQHNALGDEAFEGFQSQGLGLYIIKHLVACMGGVLSVDSKEGVGTTFGFSIAYTALEEQDKITSITEEETNMIENGNKDEVSYASLEGKTVLLVEDDEVSAELISIYLEDTGVLLLNASSKDEAFRLLAENPKIDIVFTDMVLLNASGEEVLQKVQQMERKIPVIAQTGLGTTEDREKALKQGFEEYLLKPINQKQLIDTLTKYMSTEEYKG